MYKIGEFSKLCKVSVNTLRYYDAEGLLKPDYIDKFTGYRFYASEKLKQFHTLTALKDAGFSLDEINFILQSSTDIGLVIEKKENELKSDLLNVKDRLSRLTAIKKSLQKEGKNMLSVIVKECNYVKIASVRKLIETRDDIEKITAEIKTYLISNSVPIDDIGVVINYEIEHVDTNLDYEIGVSFKGKLPKNSPYAEKIIDIKDKTIGVVCNTNEIENGYNSLSQYIGEQNYQITGAFYEFYHDDKTVEIFVPACKLTERISTPKNDDINLPFEDDQNTIGYWEVVDCLPSKEQFNKDKLKYTGHKQIKELYFLPSGEKYWCFGWTKDYLLSSFGYPDQTGKNKYLIETIAGQNYMFLEMKLDEYYMQNGRPEIWVLKQTDNIAHTKADIRIKDNTELLFIKDDAVIGKWVVCNIVKEIDSLDPDIPNPHFPTHSLFWRTVEFLSDGDCKITYGDNTSYEKPHYTWTKDYVLAHISGVAERYELKRLKGCDYLFIEWKSGDYSFGGVNPPYYVFRREN